MTTPEQPSSTGWPSDTPLPPPPAAQPPAAQPPAAQSAGPVSADEPVAEERAPEEAPVPVEAVVPAPAVPVPAQARPGDLDEPHEPVASVEPVAADDAPAADATAAAPARQAGGRLGLPVIALLLTTLLMAVATAFVWYEVHRHDQTEAARRSGLEASRDAARVLFSYDYRTLDKDFAAGKAVTTGAFAKEYATTTTTVVAPVAKDKKAVVKAEVVGAGIVRATPTTAVAVVYVNQVTTSSLTTGPKVDLSRVRMTLTKVNGRWLVSKVEAL